MDHGWTASMWGPKSLPNHWLLPVKLDGPVHEGGGSPAPPCSGHSGYGIQRSADPPSPTGAAPGRRIKREGRKRTVTTPQRERGKSSGERSCNERAGWKLEAGTKSAARIWSSSREEKGGRGRSVALFHRRSSINLLLAVADSPGSLRSGPVLAQGQLLLAVVLFDVCAGEFGELVKGRRPVFEEEMDKYEVVKDIGSGNFGVARLMRHKETKELVAMKYIERGYKIDENVAREIINHRSLRHPNIIRFKEARYFFQQLISGVSYCHHMQICHRDLKLENTLLDGSPAPRLKICDFGYSKVRFRSMILCLAPLSLRFSIVGAPLAAQVDGRHARVHRAGGALPSGIRRQGFCVKAPKTKISGAGASFRASRRSCGVVVGWLPGWWPRRGPGNVARLSRHVGAV
ncbi:hypothetical protein Taro_020525 [Colocasia esculenta]|uniref:non-specific serine/threonine protein kinase n=1 Tax=Colocasia esculenta TaxID=4460 RepID=A0A843UWI2_COLES|nr:hypothetical protein [Colocasia esculenta]